MLAPPHRVFGNSPEFLALQIGSQYAHRAVYKLHESRVIEARPGHDHLDTLQLQLQQHLVLGLRPREVVETIWADWTTHDVARTNEFGDIYLPLLSGDRVREARRPRPAEDDDRAAENLRVSRANWVKRHGGGTKDPERIAELHAAHDAQYRPRRPRGTTLDVTSAPSSAGTRAAVTAPRVPGTSSRTPSVTPSASLSPSPSNSTSLHEGEGERNSPETKASDTARGEVTGPEVTTGDVTPGEVTKLGVERRVPRTPIEELSDARLADLALEGLALGGPRWSGGHEDDEERAALVAVMRARRYTVDDLRRAGATLRGLDFAVFYNWAPNIVQDKAVTLTFLLGRKENGRYPATQLLALVGKAQAEHKRAADLAEASAREQARLEAERRSLTRGSTPSGIPGPVKIQGPAPLAQAAQGSGVPVKLDYLEQRRTRSPGASELQVVPSGEPEGPG